MSNVAVIATGEVGLEVDVVLGSNVRKTHSVDAGESVELTVDGGQTLVVRKSVEAAPTAEAEGDLTVGVDVEEDDKNAEGNGDKVIDPNPGTPYPEDTFISDKPTVASEGGGAVEETVVSGAEVDADGQPNPPDFGGEPAVSEQGDLFGDGANPFATNE